MSSLSPSRLNRLRRAILGISPAETTFDRRGFTPSSSRAQTHLEKIGRTFVTGYHSALESVNADELGLSLTSMELEFRGFAFEGAAMGLMLLDHLTPWNKGRFQQFLRGPGEPHTYMVHVGAGWAYARLPWLRMRMTAAIAMHDPLLRWLAVDGFGFHEGYFAWPRVGVRQRVPGGLGGYARRAFDQGLGRSLWFVCCGDAQRIVETIGRFDEPRRADLWGGIGLACAYAGGCTEEDIARLCTGAHQHSAALAQGAAFAAKARLRAGNLVPHTERACQILCGIPAREAAAVTDSALKDIPADGTEPVFEIWRRRIQREFAAVRR